MISGGEDGGSRLPWPPLPLGEVAMYMGCYPPLPPPPQAVGHSTSDHLSAYDLSARSTGDRKVPVPRLADRDYCTVQHAMESGGCGIARVA